MRISTLLNTAGGKIQCLRCQAHSKRTKVQCGAPAEKGKKVCRFHGARSTGAKSEDGRLRIARSKVQHGEETRLARTKRSANSIQLRVLEDILFLIKAANGTRTRGRKPASYKPILTFEDAIDFMAKHPITP